MALQRGHISRPIEAGTSILDAQHLPPRLDDALEYASKRLIRKGLRVTLVALKRDYHLPGLAPALRPTTSHISLPPSPPYLKPSALSNRLAFANASVTSFRKLMGSNAGGSSTSSSAASTPGPTHSYSCLPTPPLSPPGPLSPGVVLSKSVTSFDSNLWNADPRWPATPRTPRSPPMVNHAATFPMSTAHTSGSGPGSLTPNAFGIRFVCADPLTEKQDRLLRQTLERAGRKFHIGTDWLTPPLDPSKSSLTGTLVRRSLVQNEVIFSSQGLTLVSLDRLYTFKAALASYSRDNAPARLEDAVDELRRLILSRRTAVTKADLLQSYHWLALSDAALIEVDRMYRKAYGGIMGVGPADDGFSIRGVIPPCRSPWRTDDSEADSTDFEDDTLSQVSELERRIDSELESQTNFSDFCKLYERDEPEERVETWPKERGPSWYWETGETLQKQGRAIQEPQEKWPRERGPSWYWEKGEDLQKQGQTIHPFSSSDEESRKSVSARPSPDTPAHLRISKRDSSGPISQCRISTPGTPGTLGTMESFATFATFATFETMATPKPATKRDSAAPNAMMKARMINKPLPPTPPKAPVLKLQTQFDVKPLRLNSSHGSVKSSTTETNEKKHEAEAKDKAKTESIWGTGRGAGVVNPTPYPVPQSFFDHDDDDEDGQLTARPRRKSSIYSSIWSPVSIAEVLDDRRMEQHQVQQTYLQLQPGPMTPKGYDDISPITRGEWGFLMREGNCRPKTAAVVTW